MTNNTAFSMTPWHSKETPQKITSGFSMTPWHSKETPQKITSGFSMTPWHEMEKCQGSKYSIQDFSGSHITLIGDDNPYQEI